MNKFTFKMKSRTKMVIVRPASNSCSIELVGKKHTVFRFSKKRASELIDSFYATLKLGMHKEFVFKGQTTCSAGSVILSQPNASVESYTLVFKKDGMKFPVFLETEISRKQVKKIIKIMKEVYGIE